MSLKEKVAYLKGLAEGLGFDSESKEGKLISVIIDTLAIMAEEIEELNENALDIGEELDAISSDLADVEEFLFDDDFDDDYDYDDFMGFDDDDDDYDYDDDDEDFDDECTCGMCGGAGFPFETSCPFCGADLIIEEADLVMESIKCPSCGEKLDFDFDDDDDDDEEEDD